MIKKIAFTLAEVLIVIGIIGIVAEMLVPSLVASTEEKIIVTQVKEVYSILTQALKMSEIDNGTADMWGCPVSGGGNDTCALDKLTPYLQIAKNCGASTGCFPSNVYKRVRGTLTSPFDFDSGAGAKAKLRNGMAIDVMQYGSCSSITGNTSNLALRNVCGEIDVDINGDKSPNRVGKDFFVFYYTKYGVVPAGTPDDNSMYALSIDCARVVSVGLGCAGWVVMKENLDYLNGAVSW